METIHWKNIFNASLQIRHDIREALSDARKMGYPYFTWNDKVYSSVSKEVVATLDKDVIIPLSVHHAY
jgi:hypothetical protein